MTGHPLTPTAPDGYNPHDYPPFAVTVDLAIFTIREGALKILLIEREDDPYAGAWALPGGFVDINEDIEDAAWRELQEETSLERFSGHLEQLRTYGTPRRDPRMRVVSVAYVAFAPDLPDPVAGSDTRNAHWWDVDDLNLPGICGGNHDSDIDGAPALAFDHATIAAHALDRVASKLEYTALATAFCTSPFTLSELRHVYETVWGVHLDRSNFRRWIDQTNGLVKPVDGELRHHTGGRPAAVHEAGSGIGTLHPPLMRPDGARTLRTPEDAR